MKQPFKQHQKTREWTALVNDKDEIMHRAAYYELVLKNCAAMQQALQKKIDAETDEYQKCKYVEEQLDCELKIETTKNFYNHWNGRRVLYNTEMVMLVAERDAHYDTVLAEANRLAERDTNLARTLKNWEDYKTKLRPEDDQEKMKTDSYIFMKKVIVDYYEKTLKKEFVLPEVKTAAPTLKVVE